jgi:hypothetical protein
MNDDLLITVKQINEKYKSSLYVLYVEDMVVACSSKYDLDKFLEGEDTLVTVHDDNLEAVVLVYGIVLNHLELPFEIPEELMKDRNLWLITDESNAVLTMEPFESVKDLTEAIEDYLRNYNAHIDDFAVILAEDLDMCLKVGSTGTSLQIAKVYG